MEITDAKWQEESRRMILCKIDGVDSKVPADEKNKDYAEMLRQAIVIADPD